MHSVEQRGGLVAIPVVGQAGQEVRVYRTGVGARRAARRAGDKTRVLWGGSFVRRCVRGLGSVGSNAECYRECIREASKKSHWKRRGVPVGTPNGPVHTNYTVGY